MPRNAFIIEAVLSIIKKLNTYPKRKLKKHPWTIYFLPPRTNIICPFCINLIMECFHVLFKDIFRVQLISLMKLFNVNVDWSLSIV